ncbi:MAG: hypothetical protein EF813_02925 [Methanosarcinales archaeon]|nr:MAG: hypothetical protein EF813_02925 [Methanosarcinales archaeon]
MSKELLLFLCMLIAMVPPVCAIGFDMPETTVAEVIADPEYYDATFTRGTIGLTGTLINISDNPRISDGELSVAIDMRQSAIFDGFEDGDTVKVIGAFYYRRTDEDTFIPEGIVHWPLINAGTVSIPEISSNPAQYNGKKVTIIGNLSSVRESGMGHRLDVESDGAYIKVLYYGGTALEPGVHVRACGIFNAGMLYADTFGKKTALPFGIPGFSGIATICVLSLMSFMLQRNWQNNRKR